MPFAYYHRLTRAEKAVYRRSDAIDAIPLLGVSSLQPLVAQLAEALASGNLGQTRTAANRLLTQLTTLLRVLPLRPDVQARRPARTWGELHGLYVPSRTGRAARVTLWMRTAHRQQVVAFRTFLRTLLHELCHHLDYERFGLTDSFHTEGFYKRESHLFRQLTGAHPGGPDPAQGVARTSGP